MGTAEVQDACLYSTLPQFQAGTAHIGSRKQQLSARTRLELGKKTLLKGRVARGILTPAGPTEKSAGSESLFNIMEVLSSL